MPRIVVHPKRCMRCCECVAVCPGHLRIGDGYIMVDWASCDACGKCAAACKRGAIVLAGAVKAAAATARPPAQPESPAIPPVISPAIPPVIAHATLLPISPAIPPVVAPLPESAPRRRKRVRDEGKRVQLPVWRRSQEPATTPDESPRAAAPAPAVPAATPRPRAAPRASAAALGATGTPWEFADVLAVIAASLALFFAKDALLGTHAILTLADELRLFVRLGTLCAYYAAQIALLVWLARRHGVEPLVAFRLDWPPAAADALRAAGPVVALLLVTRVATSTYQLLAGALGFQPPNTSSSDLTVLFGRGIVGFLLSIGLVVVVGPLIEEIAFRGVILQGIRRRFGDLAGIFGSAVLFGAFHFQLWVFLPMTLFGVALGWIALRRKTLWPAVVVHALYNAVAVAAAFYFASKV